MGWLDAPSPDARAMLWLKGPAGIGKTAILQTIAERCASEKKLAGSFFFSYRAPQTRARRYLVPTLAYQLAQNVPEMTAEILRAVERDPRVFEKNMQSQMETLVLQPSKAATKGEARCRGLIVIDALDECERDTATGRCNAEGERVNAEKVHREVLKVLWDASSQPWFPFRILVGSRPERAIRVFFLTDRPQRNVRHIALDEQCGKSDEDIALLLRCRLESIGDAHGSNVGDPGWVTEDIIKTLVRRASGQFIYAATILRWIEEGGNRAPQERLRAVIEEDHVESEGNPFKDLDALYRRILLTSSSPKKSALWLKIIQFLSVTKQLTALFVDQFLEVHTGEAENVLGCLHSILSVPDDKERQWYRFYHLSLPEFLCSPHRSKELFVTDEEWVNHFVLRYLSLGPEQREWQRTSTASLLSNPPCRSAVFISLKVPDMTGIVPSSNVVALMLQQDVEPWVKRTLQSGNAHCCWNLGVFYDWVHCKVRIAHTSSSNSRSIRGPVSMV